MRKLIYYLMTSSHLCASPPMTRVMKSTTNSIYTSGEYGEIAATLIKEPGETGFDHHATNFHHSHA